MKWAHLPVSGGIYDQDPMLFKYWDIIWAEEGEVARKEQEKREQEMKQRKASSGARGGRRGKVAGRRR
jgi:hypothetical protein